MRHVYRAIAGVWLGLMFSSAAAAAVAAPGAGNILILPFHALNESDYQPWLGRSIQESVLAELTAVAPGRAISSDVESSDASAARKAGRKAGARYVVYGSFAATDQDLRMTGQVLDVATGKLIAGLKATGPASDVFQLEDSLARQVRQRLAIGVRPPRAVVSPAVIPPPHALRVAQQASADQYYQTYVVDPQNYNPSVRHGSDYTRYYYGNPYAGYLAPCYGWGWCGVWSAWGVSIAPSFGGYPYP